MKSYLKYKPAWFQVLVFGGLTFGIFLALSFVSLAVIAKIYDVSWVELTSMNLNNPAVLRAAIALQAVTSLCLFAIPSLVFGYLSDPRPLRYVGFRSPNPAVFWLLAIGLLLVSLPAVAWLADLNRHIHLPKSLAGTEKMLQEAEERTNDMLRKFLTMKSPRDLMTMLLVLAVIPAIAEELFFRGVLQRLFIQIFKRPWVGILVTAFIFSAIHGQFLGFIPRFVLGALLGALYWYSGSLWPGIIAHFINNALQVVLVYRNPGYIDQEPQFGAWLIVFSSFAMLALTVWMTRISHTHYAEVYDTEDEFHLHM